MSDEDFLKRWSRRKQEARETSDVPPRSPVAAEEVTQAALQAPADAEVDLSKLPPVDSIDATTDVTAFLRENIPLDLSRAALRRAWAADPAIRDFVGLAENAWDFTDPAAMPGFGPLDQSAEQIASMVERVVGGMRDAVEKMVSEAPEDGQNQALDRAATRVSPDPVDAVLEPPAPASSSDTSEQSAVAAVQPEASDVTDSDVEDIDPPRRRSHGGALPS